MLRPTSHRATSRLYAAVVAPHHRLAQAKSVEVLELVSEPLLVMPPDTGSRILLEQACREAGSRLRNVRLESGAYSALVEMAHAGHGVAVVLSTVLKARPDARALPVVHRTRQLGVWTAMIWRRDVQPQPLAKAFVEAAVKLCRKDYPGEKFGIGALDASP